MERFPVVSMMDCGEKIIYSRHVHDYQEFTDSKGQYFMLDGGLDYQRFSSPKLEIRPHVLFNDDPIILLREHILWGKNYNEKKELLPKTEYVLIKDITDDHLNALIGYLAERNHKYLGIFIREREFRTKL